MPSLIDGKNLEACGKSGINTEIGIYILKIYFNFGYYVGYCPFKFVRNPTTGFYTIQTSLLRKILSGALQVVFSLNFLNFFKSTHLQFLLTFNRSPEYFHVANFASSVLYVSCVLITYFKNYPAISKVFSHIGESCLSEKYIPLNFKQKSLAISILLAFALNALISAILIAAELNNWDPKSTIFQISHIAVDELTTSVWSWMSLFAKIGISMYTCFVTFYADPFYLFLIFLYWQVSQKFYSNFPSLPPLEVVANFKIMREHVKIINKAIRYMMIAVSIPSIPFIALGLGNLSHGISTWTEAIRNIFFAFYVIAGLSVSAYCHAKISYFQEWLFDEKNYKQIPNSDLQVILHEVNSNKCGLTAVGGMFTLTYGFLGSILLLVVGYVVVILQDGNQRP